MKLTAFINGKKFTNGREIEIFNPSNDELLGSVPSCSKDDVDMAFEAANNAFKNFKKSKISFRSEILEKISKVLLENTDELAELISKEVAKPIKDSKTEVIRSVDIITETIKEYQKIINNPRVYGEEELKTNKKKAIYHLEPLGVVLAITPFNYPINLLVAKIAPAIISGNTMVIKAASSGSLVTARFIELIHEQNIPDGIINLVSGAGREIGDYIVTNKYKAGEKIPSVRELAYIYKVNPNTICKALNELEDVKLIYTERTNGKFVTSNKKVIESYLKKLALEKTTFYVEEMKKLGFSNKEIIKMIERCE